MGKKKQKSNSKTHKGSSKSSSREVATVKYSDNSWQPILTTINKCKFEDLCRQIINTHKFEELVNCCNHTIVPQMKDGSFLFGTTTPAELVAARLCKLHKSRKNYQMKLWTKWQKMKLIKCYSCITSIYRCI